MRKIISTVAAVGLVLTFAAPATASEAPKTYAAALSSQPQSLSILNWLGGFFEDDSVADLSFDAAQLKQLAPECQLAAAGALNPSVCGETNYLLVIESAQLAQLEAIFAGRVLEVFDFGLTSALVTLDAAGLALAASLPWVESIEPNQSFSVQLTQTNAPWHLDRLDQPALPLNGSFTATDMGAGVKVYIMDTGISTNHSDFTGRLLTGYTYYSDGNGSNDCNGHGTHVAGSAAGTTYGAAKQATLIPVRVINCDGSGTIFSVMSGLNWIAQNTFVGEPAVVNMSIGGPANATLDDAITSLSQQGLLFVVAAGNDNQNACNYSPARVPLAITVAASNRNDAWPSNPVFSNFGSCVDVIGPGVDVPSAYIGGSNTAALASGTSMAAGVVSGVAAIQMTNGYQTPQAVDTALKTVGVANVITGVPLGTNNLLVQSTNFYPTGGTAGTTPLTGPTETGDNTEVAVPPVTDDPAAGPVDTSFNVWTVRMRDAQGNLTNQAKMYAKNPIGEGKVAFFVNGREIAWIRAVDETDPKLRLVTEGPMAGIGYLVRTVNLVGGKNALEIYVNGERVRRTAYSFIG
jgi:subtilisin family serine protease